jgi:hypothetical protein
MGGATVGSMTLLVESGDEAVVSDILWLVAAGVGWPSICGKTMWRIALS